MFTALIGKKKMKEKTLAKVLVSGTLRAAKPVFTELVEYLDECIQFDNPPRVDPRNDLDFIITIFTYNIASIPQHLSQGQDKRVAAHVIRQLAWSLEIELSDLAKRIKACKSQMKHLNQPSKNLAYGIPKVIFERYDLNRHQPEFFKELRNPNPVVLKEMGQLCAHLTWDWTFLKEELRIVS